MYHVHGGARCSTTRGKGAIWALSLFLLQWGRGKSASVLGWASWLSRVPCTWRRRLLDHQGERGNLCPFSLSVGQGMGEGAIRALSLPPCCPLLLGSVGVLCCCQLATFWPFGELLGWCCTSANWPPSGLLANFFMDFGVVASRVTGNAMHCWSTRRQG